MDERPDKLDKELLKRAEDLIDGKNEHLKFTSSFLGFCAHLLSIQPKANKGFEQCLRERLLERHKESIAAASSQTERARRVNLHQAADRLKTLMYGAVEILKVKVFRQPAWKMATIGVLAVVLIIGAILGPPAVAEFFSMRRRQEIVRNCPQVQAFFAEEAEIWAFPVWLDGVRDGISKVVIRAFPPLMEPILLAYIDVKKGEAVELREIDEREEMALMARGHPLHPAATIPAEELRGKTHGEVLETIAPVFLDRVPLDIQAKLFTMTFDPDPPEALADLPERTCYPGGWYPRLVRPGIWSDIWFVSEERPGRGRGVATLAGTGIGLPPYPCEKLVITYLMFEGEVISFSWDYSTKTFNRHGIFIGVDAHAGGTITESGKVWAKGLHFVRHGDELEVVVTTSHAVFVEVVYPTMPRMTPEREQEATAIAGAHPLIQEFLDKGASVAIVDYISVQDERGVWYVPCTDKARVSISLEEKLVVVRDEAVIVAPRLRRNWTVIVNLAEERVESILERKEIRRVGEEAGRDFIETIERRTTYLYPEIREVEVIIDEPTRHYLELGPN
ncbi:hypothetical protein M1O17_00785 [Dehalococcoidia bacterium]|nr:hypothetical protein [Dehalococcoidia bacterium]